MKKTTPPPESTKLRTAIQRLKHALTFEAKITNDPFYLDGIAKAFENCLEYAWKHFKFQATQHGLEVFSPREAIKAAGQLGLVDNVESWLEFLADRNYAVHDYMGVSDKDYLNTIKDFYTAVCKIKC